jgi:dihydroflavonol-4-reductase
MARYWVGGATGFLGSHLVRTLVDGGHDVVAVSRRGGDVRGVPVTPIDVLDSAAVERSAWGSDGAFLATGKVSRDRADAELLHRVNVVGTREALAGLRRAGVNRVVVAGTSGTIAVGTDPNRVFDETAPCPLEIISRWPYYRSKHYAELEALAANAPPEFEVVVVNPSLLLGPGDARGSSTEDVERFLDRAVPAVPPGGMSFVDVRDVADAMAAAMDRGRAGERYLLTGMNCTIESFFGRLERLSGVVAPKLRMPKSRLLASLAGDAFARAIRALGGEPPVDPVSLEMSLHYWYCDPEKAVRELGFSPRDPSETLRDTLAYLRERRFALPPEPAAAGELEHRTG